VESSTGEVRSGALDASPRSWVLDLVATAVLTTIAAISAARHSLWRDEVQAWAIAASSHSLGELFDALRFEGHPPVWYLLLTPVTRLTGNPRAMLIVTVISFGAAALVVLRTAPWSRLLSVALLAGYFPLYEFTAIARGYSIGMLLTFGLCAVSWPRRGERRWPALGVVAALLALTSVANACVAAAIVAGSLVDEATRTGRFDWSRLRPRRIWVSVGAAAVAVATLGYLVRPAANVVVPSRDAVSSPISLLGSQIARSLMPAPNVEDAWWASNWMVANVGRWLTAIIGALLLAALLWTLRRSLAAVTTVVVGTALIILIGASTGMVVLHVCGNLVLAVVAGVWCYLASGARAGVARTSNVRAVTWVFGVIVALQVVGTAVALPLAWTTTFSGLQSATAHVRDQRGLPVAAEPESIAGGLAGMLGRPVYIPSSGQEQPFTVWDDVGSYGPRGAPSDAETLVKARAHAGARRSILVLDHPIRLASPTVVPLFSADGAVVPSENYYGYLLLPVPRSR
jgi:hypothetical protein